MINNKRFLSSRKSEVLEEKYVEIAKMDLKTVISSRFKGIAEVMIREEKMDRTRFKQGSKKASVDSGREIL